MQAATDFSLAGKTALVIGGTSGIGKAIAAGYLRSGAQVVIAGRDAGKLAQAQAELARLGPVTGHPADVSTDDGLRGLVGRTLAEVGHLDVLVNCQGVTVLKPAEEFSGADWSAVIDTDLRSVFFACTEVGRHMLERGSGAIINIASLASHRGWPRSALYAIAKAGVLSLTQTLGAEWAARGVRVNAISPGFFMTDLNRDKMSPERKALALARTPAGRFGEVDELVGAAIYLASPAAGFVNGQSIAVDGGFLATGL
ncbi:MAG: SDR family oxidoreductase [Burkholderiaceae bacterium]|nr:SDR family oxidoreductase [Rhodoferax sp.]MCB2004689.1 SDR family oxidoreductase [Rhodoferax sp.]MCB2031700.1 SDR family oxidoreductase [Rhodoferax sp.]MCB2039389.1 SDR family oxidoreductase [Rhodoferax sp.]MCP5261470.1 SDR family oxidoreductase [Rhodoferax sp.]